MTKARSSSKAPKAAAKKTAKTSGPRVVIQRPTSAEATRRAFGIGARRWKHIQDLVDRVVA